MSSDGKSPPPQWFTDPENPNRWRWWDGAQWTEQYAPRDASVDAAPLVASTETATPGKRRSRFMRELVGTKEERAEAKGERLAARADATEMFRASLQAEKVSASARRSGHQGDTPTLGQMLAQLALEPLREPLDEQVEVVGETYNIAGIKKVFRGRSLPIPSRGIEITEATCVLVPEPWNPHDANAVAVAIDGQQVGHLPAELAVDYATPLAHIAGGGFLVTGVARVWAKDDGSGMVRARITILIPDADLLS